MSLVIAYKRHGPNMWYNSMQHKSKTWSIIKLLDSLSFVAWMANFFWKWSLVCTGSESLTQEFCRSISEVQKKPNKQTKNPPPQTNNNKPNKHRHLKTSTYVLVLSSWGLDGSSWTPVPWFLEVCLFAFAAWELTELWNVLWGFAAWF